MSRSPLKLRECALHSCRALFAPRTSLHRFDRLECFLKDAELSGKARRRADRRERRLGLEELKSRKQLTKEAQVAFNAFVRERDLELPCISCGGVGNDAFTGGGFDCGHYRTVGAAPQLRFDERNAHKQCKACNSGTVRIRGRVAAVHDAERYSTVRSAYRANLIGRIGLAAVESLESDHSEGRWTAEQLREIRDKYRRLKRALRATRKKSCVGA